MQCLLSGGHEDDTYVSAVSLHTLNHSKQHYLALGASLHSLAELSEMLGGCQGRVSWQY